MAELTKIYHKIEQYGARFMDGVDKGLDSLFSWKFLNWIIASALNIIFVFCWLVFLGVLFRSMYNNLLPAIIGGSNPFNCESNVYAWIVLGSAILLLYLYIPYKLYKANFFAPPKLWKKAIIVGFSLLAFAFYARFLVNIGCDMVQYFPHMPLADSTFWGPRHK